MVFNYVRDSWLLVRIFKVLRIGSNFHSRCELKKQYHSHFVTATNFSDTEVTGVTLRIADHQDAKVPNIHAIQAFYKKFLGKLTRKQEKRAVDAFIYMRSNFPENFSPFY